LDDISTGASGDIQQASSTARNMVMRYGMSEKLGPISYDSSGHSIFIGRDFGQTKSYSEETAALIDEEVKKIFEQAAADCESRLPLSSAAITPLISLMSISISVFSYKSYEKHCYVIALIRLAGIIGD
ncbi:MAG: hypothetical protein MJY42_05745, partial [Bacteroidales bacterium]|nr:hypothetical protein [Bacteroidales bacterium]